jgi:hypothetical protein
MTPQIEIIVSDAQRTLPDGVVTSVKWVAVKRPHIGGISGETALPPKDPSDAAFVPFDRLTKEQVVQWVMEAIGQEQIAEIEAVLVRYIAHITEPQIAKTANGLPWAQAPVEPAVAPEEEPDSV